jgi:TetR/AcrR family transcriptional regulator, transcriptional repressor for nem operon
MRKSREETAQTRQRIVETGAIELRRNGITGTGLADVMAAAGLTHGGFYRHFDSKDALVKECLTNALDSLRASIETATATRPGRAGVLFAIDEYLSTAHRDSEACCPFVTLGSELARASQDVRDAATAAFLKLAEVIAGHLDVLAPAAAKKEALVLLSTMVGAMTMARLVSDNEVSASILAWTRKSLSQQVRETAPPLPTHADRRRKRARGSAE